MSASTILNLLFPVRCLGCHKMNCGFLCHDCLKTIPLIQDYPSKKKFHFLDQLITAGSYSNPLLKKAIHCYKYDFVRDLSEPLGQLMANALVYPVRNGVSNGACLIPVPLSKKRLRWRGFSQSELLAQSVGNILNIPLETGIIGRIKNTPPQAKIQNKEERKLNMQDAFQVNENIKNIKNKTIILIDDIATTGATLEECAKVLKPLKPKRIIGLVTAGE